MLQSLVYKKRVTLNIQTSAAEAEAKRRQEVKLATNQGNHRHEIDCNSGAMYPGGTAAENGDTSCSG